MRHALGPAFALATGAAALPAAAQTYPSEPTRDTDSASVAFIATARVATARYRDLALAAADGYRRIGGELPGMGEHWVNTGLVLRDTLDAARPPILIYVRTGGAPLLAGAAYTRLLRRHESYPDFPAGVPRAWHEHNGSVADETLPLGHIAAGHAPAGDTRIAVLHAWLWVENPAGVWAADNWALPYIRLSLRPGAPQPGPDARALALLTGGDVYYLNAIAAVGEPSAAELEQIRAIVARARARAAVQASRLRGDGPDASATAAELAQAWRAMWVEIRHAVRPEVTARLVAMREALR